MHLRIHGKGGKVRFVPAHPAALGRIADYLADTGHGEDAGGPLFRPVKNPYGQGGKLDRALTPGKVDECVVKLLLAAAGIDAEGIWSARCPCDGRHPRARPGCRHRQGAGVAGALQHRHHPDLRPSAYQTGRQSNLPDELLSQGRRHQELGSWNFLRNHCF